MAVSLLLQDEYNECVVVPMPPQRAEFIFVLVVVCLAMLMHIIII